MAQHPKRKWLLVIALVAFALLASACAPQPAPPPPPCGPANPPDAVTSRLLARTNSDRAAHGLAPLAWHGRLWCLGKSWSDHLSITGGFYHQDLGAALRKPEYSSYRTLGENILRGSSSLTADQMQDAWMASPSHRANILSGAFRYFGVGVTYASDGRVYVAAEFGG